MPRLSGVLATLILGAATKQWAAFCTANSGEGERKVVRGVEKRGRSGVTVTVVVRRAALDVHGPTAYKRKVPCWKLMTVPDTSYRRVDVIPNQLFVQPGAVQSIACIESASSSQ